MYPTASAPQYAFGPGLAPVPMPGMAQGGLAALVNQYRRGGGVRYFENGGDTGDSSPTGGADSSTEGGAGAAFTGDSGGPSDGGVSGGNEAGAAAQAAAQGVDNAVAAAQDADAVAAAEATIAGQVAAEADEAEAEAAANTAAALTAQAESIAAEMAAQEAEDAKAAEMAAVMSGKVEGFPGPPQDAPGISFGFQSPFNMQGKPVSLTNNPFVNDFVTVNTPMGPMGVNALSIMGMGGSKAAQAANAAVGAGKALGFAEGGVASLANRVQERGRGQDTMLVHMTPKEVGGLQALAMAHGGSLSINPRTGLVEAGFLSSILPMVAGAALAPFTGGLSAALLVGGGYGLATGSLSKGLMAGLGAFGGAGLGSALSAAGATAAPALTGTAPGLAQAGVVAPQAAMSAAPGSFQAALPGLGVSTAGSAVAPAAATTFAPAAAPVTFGNMASGIPALGTEAGRTAALQSLGGGTGAIKTVGMAAAPLLAGGFGDESSGLPIQDQFIRPFRYETGRQNVPYRTGERGESTAEQAYFDSRFTPVGVYKAGTEPAYGTYAMGGSIEEGVKNGDIRAFDDEYGQDEYYGGGLTALAAGGSPNKPRFLMGKGDGMSDSIPATINDTQPARLADGEFVIPADVVSHLGNGSSKAGAAKLHSMMNRIRKARTGKKRQAPEVRAERYMPA